MPSPKGQSKPRRRIRVVVLVAGALFILGLINGVAISVHISDLRHQAAVELRANGNADDALERQANAADLVDVRMAFELLTLASTVVLVGSGARLLHAYRSPRR